MRRTIDANMLKAEFTGNFQKEYGIAQIKAIIDTMPTIEFTRTEAQRWSEELQELRVNYRKQKEINLELVEENEDLKNQNAKLKRLLKLAVEDMKTVSADCYDAYPCIACKHGFTIEDCPAGTKFEWCYADEVKELIENENELDTGV